MTTKGTRLRDDWQPGPEYIEYAIGLGFTAYEARAIGEDFRDYWVAQPGQRGVRADWLATWRNWTRKQAKREDKQPPREPTILGEPLHDSVQSWRRAEGQVKAMFEAMHKQGCPEDVLDQLFTEGCGITHITCDRGQPPTPVFKSAKFTQVWDRAASGYAGRAGYNRTPYSVGFVEYLRKKAQDIADGLPRVVGGKWVNKGDATD